MKARVVTDEMLKSEHAMEVIVKQFPALALHKIILFFRSVMKFHVSSIQNASAIWSCGTQFVQHFNESNFWPREQNPQQILMNCYET